MKFIRLNRKFIIGIFSFVAISAVFGYYYIRQHESKPIIDPTESKRSNDSVTIINSETISDALNPKPEVDQRDGSIKIVEEFVKSHAQNPNTFEFLEWSRISSEGNYWKVRCKYRGVASFNKEVTTNAWFYIQNNKVRYTKIISKI